MIQNKIKLPLDALIDAQYLAQEIAKSIYPTGEEAKGIDCIINKMIPFDGFKHGIPTKLSNEDINLLENILPDLPVLHGRMSKQEVFHFIDAYHKHPAHPKWYPWIIGEQQISANKNKQHNLYIEHHKELQNAFLKGEINAVDSEHKSVKCLGSGTYIPREDVIKYLKKIGLEPTNHENDKLKNRHVRVKSKIYLPSKGVNFTKNKSNLDVVVDVSEKIQLNEAKVNLDLNELNRHWNSNSSPRKTRRDLLIPCIEAIQRTITDPFDTAAIWTILRSMAEANTPPLQGVILGKIRWINSDGEAESFSRDALRMRLNRSKKMK